MNHALDHHLRLDQCARFFASDLTGDEEQSLIQHLDRCEACRAVLESAAGNHYWWTAAHDCLHSSNHAPHTDTNQATRDEATNRADLTEQLRHIMISSDDPQMLGRIANYEVIGVIGRGGTGIVVKAWERSLDRFVAIKVLTAELSLAGAARERFHREARAAAAVRHENVIPIYAVSEFRGHPFLVMQYVPGQSLEQRLHAQGTLDVTHIIRIAMQVAGLAAAHAQGLVHRDIKPGNILLEEGIDRPIVTDFGLVRVASDASLTHSGTVTGTPNYMSPEQANSQPVDGRSDLFSLGSVIYAMATGHAPFRSDSLLGVLRRVVEDQPSAMREHNPRVPIWLEAFVQKLLAKSADDRFASADEVAELLSAELAHLQNPLGYPQPLRLWSPSHMATRRHRRSMATLGWLSIAVAAWIVLQTSSPSPTNTPAQRAVPTRSIPRHADDTSERNAARWNSDLNTTANDLVRVEASLQRSVPAPTTDAWNIETRQIAEELEQLEHNPW